MSDTSPAAPTPQAPGMDAWTLANLAQRMRDAGDHWFSLNQPDRAIQCHIAAALYSNASGAAYVNDVPIPTQGPAEIKPFWMMRTT